jgi:hypothetical protein
MRAHCERCAAEVEASYRRPRARRLARGYPLLIVPFLPFIPIIAADYVVMIPLLMFYMVGFGQAMGILRDPPLCDDCGAIVKALPKAPKALPKPAST